MPQSISDTVKRQDAGAAALAASGASVPFPDGEVDEKIRGFTAEFRGACMVGLAPKDNSGRISGQSASGPLIHRLKEFILFIYIIANPFNAVQLF